MRGMLLGDVFEEALLHLLHMVFIYTFCLPYPCLYSAVFGTVIKHVQFDQGRLINLSTMLNLKSL